MRPVGWMAVAVSICVLLASLGPCPAGEGPGKRYITTVQFAALLEGLRQYVAECGADIESRVEGQRHKLLSTIRKRSHPPMPDDEQDTQLRILVDKYLAFNREKAQVKSTDDGFSTYRRTAVDWKVKKSGVVDENGRSVAQAGEDTRSAAATTAVVTARVEKTAKGTGQGIIAPTGRVSKQADALSKRAVERRPVIKQSIIDLRDILARWIEFIEGTTPGAAAPKKTPADKSTGGTGP